ncbi:OmpA family protein [Rhodobacterales bacterium]|nr:OmpA family protein [Rhodobacterales bacterium]
MTPNLSLTNSRTTWGGTIGRTVLAVAFAATFTGLSAGRSPVMAQDTGITAEDVSKHFKQLKTRSLQPTGKTRALCIGTRDECNPDGAASEGGQVAVTQDGGKQAETLVVDPETNAIDAGLNLLVSFEYASARLSPGAKANLREFAEGISDPELADATFLIEGHTDGIGSTSYNQRLSEDRAAAVAQFLATLGVERARLKTVGYGKSRPKVVDNINDPANRRVESKLVIE